MNRNVVGLDIAKQVFHLFMMLDGKEGFLGALLFAGRYLT